MQPLHCLLRLLSLYFMFGCAEEVLNLVFRRIIPLLWTALLVFLFFSGKINWGEDWKMTVFPTLIFFLFWIQGHQVAKKKEIAKMKAKDMQ